MRDTTKEVTKKTNVTFLSPIIVGLLFFTFYVLGELFPDYWWSTHSSHFLNPVIKYSIFLAAFFGMILSLAPNQIQRLVSIVKVPNQFHSSIMWLFSLLMGFLFYQFPMVADYYGEAYILNPQVHQTVSKVSQVAANDLFSFGLNPWAGQKTIIAFITYLAFFTGETIYTCILYFDAFFGFCFMLTWLTFVNQNIKDGLWKLILAISVGFAPFLLNFYGHLEINAIVLWVNLFWMTLFVRYFKNKDSKTLWILLLVLVFSLKIHAIALLLSPVWLFICVSHYFKQSNPTYSITWSKVTYFVLAPVFALGAFCYFFVFKDYNDSRNLAHTVKEYDHLFLPIVSPEAPLDKYNLFSFNHIFDYFSELLLWSPIALFIIAVIVISLRKKINWHREELIVTASIFIIFATFFFVLNPLLSMQMDWDLFTFPAPILLVLLVLLVKQIQEEKIKYKVLPISMAIGILTLPFFLVHYSKFDLSLKLQSLGVRIYHTYYEWSSQTIHNALILLSENRQYQFERKNVILYKLAEDAVVGNDREYGLLWSKEGAYLLDYEKNPSKAYVYLEKGLTYSPNDNYAKLLLLESCLLLDQNDQAYELSLQLNQDKYPDAQTASITRIQTALYAEKFNEALQHSSDHLIQWSNDTVMRKINTRLKNNDKVEELEKMFFIPK
ncbi:hypothetical protein GYB57_15190 [bacterium]|nr:hypothetical protein [bacterium]